MRRDVFEFVEREMEELCPAHDIHHIKRVYKLAEIIYESEQKWDKIVVLISALLHEVLDEKFFSEDIDKQASKVLEMLKRTWISELKQQKILFILENIWYRRSLWRKVKIEMPEYHIVEDADRLDSMWAIGIARTFAYGWKKWIPIYDPEIAFDENITKEKYSKSSTSINHFYEKLLKLKKLMNTKKWKEMARKKHKFLEKFLKEFHTEWEADY